VSSASNQTKYQVRFEWGIEGAAQIAPGAHIVVWADALPDATANPLAFAHDGALVTGSTGSRAALAAWVLQRQAELGDRVVVAVVAAGGPNGRFAVEDLLAAGAVIDALGEAGIDFTSPEAAAAAGAYASLRNATNHVLSASVGGQEAGSEAVTAAREANARADFGILREFRGSA